MEDRKLLTKFIEKEREATRTGSGDDMYYEQQIVDYINKQKGLWISFVEFIKDEICRTGKKPNCYRNTCIFNENNICAGKNPHNCGSFVGEEKVEDELKELTKTHNVRLQDMTDIGMGYGIEIARKNVMKAGFNPMVPNKNGKAIYQGEILFFKGKNFEECVKSALQYVRRETA